MDIDQSLGLKNDTWYDKIILHTAGLIFATTLVMASFQVAIRTLNLPLDWYWTEPVGRFALVIGTFFGAAVASRNNENIKLEFLLERVGRRYPRFKYIVDIIVLLTTIVTLAIVVYYLMASAITSWPTNVVGVGWVTLGMIYLCIGIGLALMLVFETIKLWQLLSDGLRNEESGTPTGGVP